MITIGDYELVSVINGTIRLDGGAMFGTVPKVLWQNLTEVDSLNRIRLATRTLLAIDKRGGQIILVDTGCGAKWQAKDAERYGVHSEPGAIAQALGRFGLTEAEVTDVIVTHLHFDHNGGLTDWYDEPGGPAVLRYPRARHWLHRRQWEHARRPTVRDRASFLPQDFEALERNPLLKLLDGDEVASQIPGVRFFISRGHTPYQLLPVFHSTDCELMFVGDIVPTVAHLRLGWVMAYDLFPLRTVAEREEIYHRCLQQGMWIAFAHDPDHAGVSLDGTIERPVVSQVLAMEIPA